MTTVADSALIAEELVLTAGLIEATLPNQPLRRWLEYRAYVELVQYLVEKDALPSNYDIFKPEAKSLRDWIAGTGKLTKSFHDEIRKLLLELKEAGSDMIDDLCEFYCRFKGKLEFGNDAATVALSIKAVAEILTAYGADFLFAGGAPITTFASLLIKSGFLDEICKCP